MATGKYLSLEEARKRKGGLARFAKEHPSEGNENLFDRLLRLMAGGGGKPKAKDQTLDEAGDEGCTETRTPKGTSKDA